MLWLKCIATITHTSVHIKYPHYYSLIKYFRWSDWKSSSNKRIHIDMALSLKATHTVIDTSPTTSWQTFPSFIDFPQLITSGRSIPPALGPSDQTPPVRKHLATFRMAVCAWQTAESASRPSVPVGLIKPEISCPTLAQWPQQQWGKCRDLDRRMGMKGSAHICLYINKQCKTSSCSSKWKKQIK